MRQAIARRRAAGTGPVQIDKLGASPHAGRLGVMGILGSAARRLRAARTAPRTRFNDQVAIELASQAARIAKLEERLTAASSASTARPEELAPVARELDYPAFEDHFRGSSASISDRQAKYLDYFHDHGEVLDVGCGRGEFLALLRDHGIPARGIDLDERMVARCRERGLQNVYHGDAVEYLRGQPDGVFGGAFVSQVVEHLTSPQLIALLGEIARTCDQGAVLVIETLNPESLAVLGRWYWLDPTHVRLIHPETLQFLIREAGFDVKTVQFIDQPVDSDRVPSLPLSGAPAEELEHHNAAMRSFSDALFGRVDYFVVGVRN